MRIRHHVHTLHLKHTFRLALSASDSRPTVVVELEHDGITGRGECAPSDRHGQSVEAMQEELAALGPEPEGDPRHFRKLITGWGRRFPGRRDLLCALDIALHDWAAQALGVPLYRLWGLDPADARATSMTVAIAEPEAMLERVREAEAQGFSILKIKVGFDGDVEVIRAIRERTDAVIRVDANEGWTREQAHARIAELAELGVEFVEQPLPAADEEGLAAVHRGSPLPIFLDESVKGAADVTRVAGYADGVVLKLVKCGGLLEAQRLIDAAHAVGLRVMIGCMIETSLGITAAAHLTPLVEHADLDSPWLIRDDPFTGVTVENGVLRLPEAPGVGVRPLVLQPHFSGIR